MTKEKVGRSAKTGRFVSKKYAESHPDTTVVETIKKSKSKKLLLQHCFLFLVICLKRGWATRVVHPFTYK